MFSSMIQNLLSSSGQANAMQRAAQMNSYIYKYNPQYVTPNVQNKQATSNIESFDKVLQASAKTKFGDLLTNSSSRVNAQIYSNKAMGNKS